MQRENNIGFNIRRLSNYIKRDIEKSSACEKIDLPKGVNGWAIGYFYENRDKEIFQRDFENRFSIRGDEPMMQILRDAFGDDNVKLQQSALKR